MSLKVKDVATLLNVSETTIHHWISDGTIPFYSINRDYYFSPTEMDVWITSQKLGKTCKVSPFMSRDDFYSLTTPTPSPIAGGNQRFNLFRAIYKGEVLDDVKGESKEEIFRSTMRKTAKSLHVDAEVMTELLLDRENLMPTALGNGIGIPHTRDYFFTPYQDAVIVVFLDEPLEYGALDGKPVHTLFFLFASEDKHLPLLAKIADLSNQPQAVEFFQKKPSKESLLKFIKEWESQLPLMVTVA